MRIAEFKTPVKSVFAILENSMVTKTEESDENTKIGIFKSLSSAIGTSKTTNFFNLNWLSYSFLLYLHPTINLIRNSITFLKSFTIKLYGIKENQVPKDP